MTKNYVHGILAFLVFLFFAPFLPVYGANEWEYWASESVGVTLTNGIGVRMEMESRWRDNTREFYRHYAQLQLDFRISDCVTVSPIIRELYWLNDKTKDPHDWYVEHRPMLDLALKYNLSGWETVNRSRLSYRAFDIDTDNVFGVRQLLLVRSPWKWTRLQINPWVSDEIWFEEHKPGLYQNWFSTGIGMTIVENFKVELYYLWEDSKKTGEWMDTNIVGTRLRGVF